MSTASFTHALLSCGRDIHAVARAAEDRPGDCTLNAYAAAAELFSMKSEGRESATPFIHRARASARTDDDRLLVAAIAAWADGQLDRAIALHRARLARCPDDLAAARICQLHHIDQGDSEGLLETVRLIAPAHPDNHYVLGQLAFALEQTGDLDRAEPIANRALSLVNADDPWTYHAVAHLLYSRGEVAASVALIESQSELWERSNAFMFAHAWWHAAISQLDDDQPDRALRIYDDRITRACPNCVQSLVAAISLLARLELAGVDVGGRWQQLAPRVAARVHDRINGFLDLHYLYALARAGYLRQAQALANALGLEGARGLLAHASGRHGEAAERMACAGSSLTRLGGSHEQRDLYTLIEIDACMRSGRRERARCLLERRVAARPSVGWQRRALTKVERIAA